MENTVKGKSRILLYGIMILLLCTIIAVQVLAQDRSRDKMKPAESLAPYMEYQKRQQVCGFAETSPTTIGAGWFRIRGSWGVFGLVYGQTC